MKNSGVRLIRFISLLGTGAMVYGLYLAWRPLGWIVGGAILAYACNAAIKETQQAEAAASIRERLRAMPPDPTAHIARAKERMQ